jgi:tetratricopeptide (TPR) repeat protein
MVMKDEGMGRMTVTNQGTVPDPQQASDLAEFIDLLGELRIWAGAPSYRTLAKRVGPLLRPPQEISASTVIDVFKSRRRRLNIDLVVGIVRALGLDERGVSRWRAACVAAHGASRAEVSVSVFRQLPASLATFTGRHEQLAQILQRAQLSNTEGASTVVISSIEGMAGVGKTKLAVQAAHQLVQAGWCTEVQLYANLRGFDTEQPPADPSTVLEAFLRQLDVPPRAIPTGLDERAAMFRDRMYSRNALVLLDNAADERQVRDLIPGGPDGLVLITSRRTLAGLDGAESLVLDVFTLAEALDLLSLIVGLERVAAEPDAAERIVQACGLLPLAVSLAAARLRSRPAWTLAYLADALDEDLDAINTRERSLRLVFSLSYEGLPDLPGRVFRMLGLHPGADCTAVDVAALTDVSVAEARNALEFLCDDSLLQQRIAGRYQMHDLLRVFAVELADAVPEDVRDAAFTRLATWSLHTAHNAATTIGDAGPMPLEAPAVVIPALAFEKYDDALTWFDREREMLASISNVAAARGLHGIVWQLALTRGLYLTLRHRMDEHYAAHNAGLASARELGEPATLGYMLGVMGSSCRYVGKFDEAASRLLEALDIRRELGNRPQEAAALISLGNLHALQDRHDEAVSMFDQALAIIDETGDLRQRGICLINLGASRASLGHHDEALRHLLDALPIVRENDNRRNELMLLANIASVHRLRGDSDAAIRFFEEHKALSKTVGDDYLHAAALLELGELFQELRRDSEAREAWTEALQILEELEHPQAETARKNLLALESGGFAAEDASSDTESLGS